MVGFVFVVADSNSGRVSKESGSFVRSHCMQGRNKKENSRRSVREARRLAREQAAKEVSCDASKPVAKPARPQRRSSDAASERARAVASPLPACLDSEMIHFITKDTDTYPRQIIFNWRRLREIKVDCFPAYNHLHFHDILDEPQMHNLLMQSLAFRQSVMLTVSAYRDSHMGRSLAADTCMRYQVIFSLLNLILSNCEGSLMSELVIHIMTGLATSAVWLGHSEEIHMHVGALRRLRKAHSTSYWLERPSMLYRVLCLEIAAYVCNGPAPGLFDVEISTADIPEPPQESRKGYLVGVETVLVCVLSDLQYIAKKMESGWKQQKPLDCNTFQTLQVSIQDRLLRPITPSDPLSQCLRLGLILFTTITTFHIPGGRNGKIKSDSYITGKYRNVCQSLDPADHPGVLVFWLLTLGVVAVFDADEEDWLVNMWAQLADAFAVHSWEEAREVLNLVVWIELLHDNAGREAFNSLKRMAEKRHSVSLDILSM
ncbi:hypothetical protein B0I35DRAFT_415636 [Stachybotrys elegans]|uniref:Transcription factor domain-containing protein n=1 Tax=Stachybotrys elegans TaxID=80388 RepID=A0A8K0T1N5_9HYPO|nr:hypothetical protein B0I35DRAFT_415636 [Stachybotrys elegans]